MKKLKAAATLIAAVTVISLGSAAVSAADYNSPADIVAELTDKTAEDVAQERIDTGKTYGTIADEAGVLDEFKEETLKLKEETLDQYVEDGLMTQEEADEILADIKEWQANCDGTGTGSAYAGTGYGRGWGRGMGYGGGCGMGRGMGRGGCW